MCYTDKEAGIQTDIEKVKLKEKERDR